MSLIPSTFPETPPSRFFSDGVGAPFSPLRHPSRVLGGLAANHPGITDRRGLSATTHTIGTGVKTFLFTPSITNVAQLAAIAAEVNSLQTELAARNMQIAELQAQIAEGGPAQ